MTCDVIGHHESKPLLGTVQPDDLFVFYTQYKPQNKSPAITHYVSTKLMSEVQREIERETDHYKETAHKLVSNVIQCNPE